MRRWFLSYLFFALMHEVVLANRLPLDNSMRNEASRHMSVGLKEMDSNPVNTFTGSFFLYDLVADPFEDTDLSSDETYLEEYLDDIQARQTYWSGLTVTRSKPSTSNQTSTWDECGRVCAWLPDQNTHVEIEQRYDYTATAPNIVYVLIDDWGYNDAGLRSTYLSWTTPTFDSLASEGVLLTNYYTNELCAPSRASFLTGRYNLRLGVYDNQSELPFSETTIAQEMKSAGYVTYMVGKWHVGMSREELWPANRGFDRFYGYYNGFETYWDKKSDGYLDLFTDGDWVEDESEIDSTYHNAYLFESKAESFIEEHYNTYPSEGSDRKPFFLYYAMQLIHYPWTAPEIYLQRCTDQYEDYYKSDDGEPEQGSYIPYNYCAMNVMMDEALSNLTCTLAKYGYSDNTVLIVAGDNGGEPSMKGNSVPFKGHKNSTFRGGVSNTAIIHSKLIPEDYRGTSFNGMIHITDWLPTLMGLATNNTWTGSYSGADIDGLDIWSSITTNTTTSRDEIVFLSYPAGTYAMQYEKMKYIYGLNDAIRDKPVTIFAEDLMPDASRMICEDPSLVDN